MASVGFTPRADLSLHRFLFFISRCGSLCRHYAAYPEYQGKNDHAGDDATHEHLGLGNVAPLSPPRTKYCSQPSDNQDNCQADNYKQVQPRDEQHPFCSASAVLGR